MAQESVAAPGELERGLVVDLSAHINALADHQDISEALSDEQETRLVQYLRDLIKMSYSRISRRYSHWQEADRAHDVYVPPDATRFREKVVIADTRAISDTVLTYLMAALTGRNPMFQLEGLNRKSRRSSQVLERVLHQHMRRTAGEAKLAQLLNDAIRYGFAPTKIVWNHQKNQNEIINFDPRRCFPDPRVQWGDIDNMQFIGFVGTMSYDALVQTGLYPKLRDPKYRAYKNTEKSGWEAHRWHREEGRGLSIDPLLPNERAENTSGSSFFTIGDARVIDEVWFKLAGYQIGLPSHDYVWLLATVLDEQHIIRLHLNPYGRQFPCVLGGLFNDANKTFSQSLYDITLPLHDIATWLLRSRIDNVQASMNNMIFADPTKVSIPDLIDRNPWNIIRTMPGANPRDGIFIQNIPDVTRNHWNDIQALSELKQRLTAASDAQQGMPTSDGIRTATEIQRLSQMGSQRLGQLARNISALTVRPMIRMMVQNIQDALEYEGAIRIGEDAPSILQPNIRDGYLDFTVADLQGEIDYLVVDGTLPIEPTRSPESWLNAVQIANQANLGQELDLKEMTLEAVRAMGIPDIDRFRIAKEQAAQGMTPSQQLNMLEKLQGATVQPNEQLQDQVQRGNLVPLRSVA